MEKYLSLVVKFSELTQKAQKRIIKNTLNEEILMEGASSEFMEVRLLVLQNESTTSKIVKQMMKKEKNERVIKKILSSRNFSFIEAKDKKEFLERNINSENPKIRYLIASYEETPKKMLVERLEKEENLDVVKAILKNNNFHKVNVANDVTIKDKAIKGALNSANKDVRLYIASSVITSAYMLLERIKSEEDKDVINAILSNKNFKLFIKVSTKTQIEERNEALKIAINSSIPEIRKAIVMYEFTPVELLVERIKVEKEIEIVREILNNHKFIDLDEETRNKVLNHCLNSETLAIRSIIAMCELTKGELLAERLKIEPGGYVVKDILENDNFKNLDESIRNGSLAVASKAEIWNIRAFIAMYELTPKNILEDMLSVEEDENVIIEIKKNKNYNED